MNIVLEIELVTNWVRTNTRHFYFLVEVDARMHTTQGCYNPMSVFGVKRNSNEDLHERTTKRATFDKKLIFSLLKRKLIYRRRVRTLEHFNTGKFRAVRAHDMEQEQWLWLRKCNTGK